MHLSSLSLGVFDWLVDAIANILGSIIGGLVQIVMEVVNRMVFMIVSQILTIVDFVQLLFRKLSGLDVYYIKSNNGVHNAESEGDILLQLFSDKTVMQVLIVLSVVAVIMLLMATIIQMVKVEFTTEGAKNTKGGIIGNALKSLALFFLVPVLCCMGVYVSSFLLKSLDAATSRGWNSSNGEGSGKPSIASQIFVCAAAPANKARVHIDDSLMNYLGKTEVEELKRLFVEGNYEQTAINIDDAFRRVEKLGISGSQGIASTDGSDKFVTTVLSTVFNALLSGGPIFPIFMGGAALGSGVGADQLASYQNLGHVINFYHIGRINMILLIMGSCIACYVMLSTCFGLIMRLFQATVLFLISPPIIALTPLDGGNAFKEWKSNFIAQILGVYAPVVALNLFFLILPVINNINLFPGTGNAYEVNILNSTFHFFVTIVGLSMMKSLIQLISKMIHADDPTGSGDTMMKKTVGTAAKIGAVAVGGGALMAHHLKNGMVGSIANDLSKQRSAAKIKRNTKKNLEKFDKEHDIHANNLFGYTGINHLNEDEKEERNKLAQAADAANGQYEAAKNKPKIKDAWNDSMSKEGRIAKRAQNRAENDAVLAKGVAKFDKYAGTNLSSTMFDEDGGFKGRFYSNKKAVYRVNHDAVENGLANDSNDYDEKNAVLANQNNTIESKREQLFKILNNNNDYAGKLNDINEAERKGGIFEAEEDQKLLRDIKNVLEKGITLNNQTADGMKPGDREKYDSLNNDFIKSGESIFKAFDKQISDNNKQIDVNNELKLSQDINATIKQEASNVNNLTSKQIKDIVENAIRSKSSGLTEAQLELEMTKRLEEIKKYMDDKLGKK